ncbi:MAG: S-methyl-5-thioribose-1-phosphate isomerase [Ignavibacteriaceae bacterium]
MNNSTHYFSAEIKNNKLVFLDQTRLPLEEKYIETDDYNRIAEAIEKLEVRGAPLIGICAAYAIALAFKNSGIAERNRMFEIVYDRLRSTRPTAVNLFYALNEMKKCFNKYRNSEDLFSHLFQRAAEIHKEDSDACYAIGKNGLGIFNKKSRVLTHCNTGKLATGGDGTAFSVIKHAFENELIEIVFADETRPLLQGLRLTAFELSKSGIPFKVLTDSSAAFLMAQKKIDIVITGADRIALNGDSANKIGTYNLALLSYYHDIPFYIAAPESTIDRETPSGEQIEIEFRNGREILSINDYRIAPEEYQTFSPAFDITPAHLIKGIITEKGIYSFPYNFLK